MRDKLIEIIENGERKVLGQTIRGTSHYTEALADHLIANGVIVPPRKGCDYCKGRAYTKRPLTVITKYGRRIELVFEFCPNCGRKMNALAEREGKG